MAADSITVTMMFIKAVEDAKNAKKRSSSHHRNDSVQSETCGNGTIKVNGFDVCVMADVLRNKPLDTLTFGILPGVRDLVIPPDENGELAKLVRDPLKRPVEILTDLRDKIVPKDDNGEGAKILRDPVKCTVGRLWGAC